MGVLWASAVASVEALPHLREGSELMAFPTGEYTRDDSSTIAPPPAQPIECDECRDQNRERASKYEEKAIRLQAARGRIEWLERTRDHQWQVAFPETEGLWMLARPGLPIVAVEVVPHDGSLNVALGDTGNLWRVAALPLALWLGPLPPVPLARTVTGDLPKTRAGWLDGGWR